VESELAAGSLVELTAGPPLLITGTPAAPIPDPPGREHDGERQRERDHGDNETGNQRVHAGRLELGFESVNA